MTSETEAKLLLSAEKQAKLLASTKPDQVNRLFDRLLSLLRFGGYEVAETQRISNRDKYFDTPKKDLFADGNLLRVREGAGVYLLTIKKRNVGSNDVMEREEVETPLTAVQYEDLRREGFLSVVRKNFQGSYGPVESLLEVVTDRLQAKVVRDGVRLKFCLDVPTCNGAALDVELEIEADCPAATSSVEPIRDAIQNVFPEFSRGRKSKLTRAIEVAREAGSSAKSQTLWWKSPTFWAVAAPILAAVLALVKALVGK